MVFKQQHVVVESLYRCNLCKIDRTHQAVVDQDRILQNVVGFGDQVGVYCTLSILLDGSECRHIGRMGMHDRRTVWAGDENEAMHLGLYAQTQVGRHVLAVNGDYCDVLEGEQTFVQSRRSNAEQVGIDSQADVSTAGRGKLAVVQARHKRSDLPPLLFVLFDIHTASIA